MAEGESKLNAQPLLTVFGSCRVVTPAQILAAQGKVRLNQKNIFGFVHNSREILQQFRLVSGDLKPSPRLRPYLNMPDRWAYPEPAPLEHFHTLFEDTDLFVIEISSVRLVQFKALFLQIHRTRELLASDDATAAWWQRLVRKNENTVDQIRPFLSDPVAIEVSEGLKSVEQTEAEVERDAARILAFLKKPVLFVTTFNCDYDGKPIPQRTIIANALRRVAARSDCAVFDPTEAVIAKGLKGAAIIDLGHYTDAFEPEVAALMLNAACPLLTRRHAAAVSDEGAPPSTGQHRRNATKSSYRGRIQIDEARRNPVGSHRR